MTDPSALLLALSLLFASGPAQPPAPQRITARFSPRGGCTELVVWHVDAARSSVFVGSYQWSSRPIHDAILRAKARGIAVRVILDPAGARTPLGRELAVKLGADVRVDHMHAIFHLKVIVRDGGTPGAAFEAGSFNYSVQAEQRNAENAVVIEGFPEVTAAYLADLEKHWAHATAPE